MLIALKRHWPEYLIEAAGLGTFMISAAVFTALMEHPDSPIRQGLDDATLRRALVGIAMGLTAIAIIYSPFGKRSGAHINPATTLTFYRLGKIEPADAAFYMSAQFLGAVAGLLFSAWLLGQRIAHPSVNYVATLPGQAGIGAALAAEAAISFGLMLMVLFVSNHRRLHRFTGLFAGLMVATYITIEAPISGMSMNPARTFGSAFPGRIWDGMWIYFVGPPLGMLLASAAYVRIRSAARVYCAKYHHMNEQRCIFRCRFGDLLSGQDDRR
jgi:aquaporin Z